MYIDLARERAQYKLLLMSSLNFKNKFLELGLKKFVWLFFLTILIINRNSLHKYTELLLPHKALHKILKNKLIYMKHLKYIVIAWNVYNF